MHDAAPLHAVMGGGDQLYNDGLWGVPSLRAWLALTGDKACRSLISANVCCGRHPWANARARGALCVINLLLR